jgi:predicted dehydrogenase
MRGTGHAPVDRVRWGILGTGKIARIFARSIGQSRTGEAVAVGSRQLETARGFGAEFGVPRSYGSYAAVLDDPEVDVVYVATPHTSHATWTIRAASAGKHVLCEKPLTLNHREAVAVIDAARAGDVFLMEAFAYRCHPQTAKLVELLREGAVGEVRMVDGVFGYDAGTDPGNYLLTHDLGGGSILDVGCYTTSMVRLVAGVARGSDRAEPTDVKGSAHIGDRTRVDHYAAASLSFPGGIVARLACAVRVNLGGVVRVFGSDGTITLPSPWLPGRHGRSVLVVEGRGLKRREVAVDASRDLYAIEADTVAEFLRDRQAPQVTWEDTLGNMTTLDRWRESVGLAYETE